MFGAGASAAIGLVGTGLPLALFLSYHNLHHLELGLVFVTPTEHYLALIAQVLIALRSLPAGYRLFVVAGAFASILPATTIEQKMLSGQVLFSVQYAPMYPVIMVFLWMAGAYAGLLLGVLLDKCATWVSAAASRARIAWNSRDRRR